MSASTRCPTPVVDCGDLHPRTVEAILGYGLWSWDPGARWFYQHVSALTEGIGEGAAFYACISMLDAAMVALGMSRRRGFIEFDRATRFPEADDVRRVVRRAIVLARSHARQGR